MRNTSNNDFDRINNLLQLWQEKLAFLEREQAILASPTGQFELIKRIEECIKQHQQS